MPTNETHEPQLRSWVESAEDPATDFPIQNLPLAAFPVSHGDHSHAHYATAIGDQLLDISLLAEAGVFDEESPDLAGALRAPACLGFLASPELLSTLRRFLQRFLRADSLGGQSLRRLRTKVLTPLKDAGALRCISPFNYTDFYASIHHATTVGSMFRPDNPLLPNYKHIPIGYHGRASSLVDSGHAVRRPRGQLPPPDADPAGAPAFGPCQMLDYELEVGCFIAPGNPLGEPIPIAEADSHILGLCLVNDWSARDIQKWEYQPLGPFLAKSFATTTSPFLITREALEPFRIPAMGRPAGDPAPLPYLDSPANQERGGFGITLEVSLATDEMRRRGLPPHRLSRASFRDMYWSFAQMIAHHSSNGCNLQPGDLIASGTVSGPNPGERGCLLELTWQGRGPDGKPLPRRPIELPSGEKRLFLQDGDEVIIRGRCEREGFRGIGFGECRGTIAPAIT